MVKACVEEQTCEETSNYITDFAVVNQQVKTSTIVASGEIGKIECTI
jgi:hypothetical protein